MQRTKRREGTTRMIAAGIAAVALMGTTVTRAEARRTHGYKGDAVLTSTGVDPDARGTLKASSKHGDGRFEVSVGKLDRQAIYDVIVGDVKVASITTSRGGSGKARLRSRPRGRDGLLGFDPRSAAVVIRDAAGRDVLFGTVPADDDPNNDADIVCCKPDDRGTKCEDRTPEECVAKGGTVSTATSCVPNPCDGATPPVGGKIVCCIPDDGGPECEDRSPAQCSAQGGTIVAAASCAPNPCASVPSLDPDVRCCLPDDGGPECEDRTAAQCAAQGGVDLGIGVCTPGTCSGVTFP